MELNQLPGVVLSGITHDLKQNHSAVLESTPATSWHMPTVWACLDDLDQAIDMGSAAHRTQALTQEVMEQDRLHDQTFTALWHLMTAAEAESEIGIPQASYTTVVTGLTTIDTALHATAINKLDLVDQG